MKFLFFFLLVSSVANSYAQSKEKTRIDIRSLVLEHNGGNGGDDNEIFITKTLYQISSFLFTKEGRDLFENEINASEFYEASKDTIIRVVTDELFDRYKNKRCALNFPDKKLAVFNRDCIENLRAKNDISGTYVLIAHEILNIIGLELPDETSGSVYTISRKLGAVAKIIANNGGEIVISKTCNLYYIKNLTQNMPRMAQKTLKEKGYNYKGTDWGKSSGEGDLYLKIEVSEFDSYRTSKPAGSTVAYDNLEYIFDETDQKRKFNGVLSFHLSDFFKDKINHESIIPVQVSNKTFGVITHTRLKSDWADSLLEGVLKLPDCVRY
jgi:hypothetical protein